MGPCPGEVIVNDFAAGRLSGAARGDVERHIDDCRDCHQALIRLLTSTLAASRTAGGQSFSSGGGGAAPHGPGGGHRFGRYLIIDDIGAGGMGKVVAAYDMLLDRKVALKFLRSPQAPEAAPALVVAEAVAMARLSHPNVVTVHDVGMEGDVPYLAMELVEGLNLAEWRQQAPRSHRQIAQVMAAAARGLAAAHAAGIVHRDVKPHNILVAGARVVVTDFGLSAEMHSDGSMAGTPAYMAPEQFRGETVDARTDVFGFCATLFEMLHGERPFAGTTTPEVREQVLNGRVKATPATSRASARLHRLALRGLAPDPADRPSGMADLADELLADPARRLRNAILAMTGAAVLVAAFWGGGYLKGHPERQCRTGADVMAGTWNEGRRAQLGRRYAEAGLEASWPMLLRRLDLYAGSWRATFADTCSATYGKRVQSEEVFDLRMQCLETQRGGVEAFLLALGSANPNQLAQAAAASVPAIGDCQITARPNTKSRPNDPAARAQIASIEQQLARSLAEQNLGDYARAAATATTAVAAARKLGYEPLTAASLVRLGTSGNLKGSSGSSDGGLEQAGNDLLEAYTLAELGRDDRQRLAAARELVNTHLRLMKLPEAATWGRLAEALLSRLGSPAEEATLVAGFAGWIHFHARRYEEAAHEFRRAIEWSRKMSPPDARRAAGAQNALCMVLGTHQGDEEPIACLREALAAGLEALGPEHPGMWPFYGNLAYELLARRPHLDEACTLLRTGIHTLRTLDPGHPHMLGAAFNLSTCLERQGQYLEARRPLERALAIKQLLPRDRADFRVTYAILLASYFDVEAAIAQLRSAIEEFHPLQPASDLMLRARRHLAGILQDQGRLGEAQKELDAAIEIARKEKATSEVAGDLYAYRAKLLLTQGRYEAAVREATLVLERRIAQGDKEIDLATARSALGPALLRLGRVDEAVATFERGLAPYKSASEFYMLNAQADLQAGLARALMQKGAERERACKLGRQAASHYRTLVVKRPIYREMERWLSQRRCSLQT